MVRKSFSPGAVEAFENSKVVPVVVDPGTSCAPATTPLPKLKTMYIGRSATIGTSELTVTDTPPTPGPTPFAASNTATVNRLWDGTCTGLLVIIALVST